MSRSSGARWSWSRSLNDPDEVTDLHIRTVYRLDKPPCKFGECESTCKRSPLCLNGLSQLDLSEPPANGTGFHQDDSLTQWKRNGLKNYGSTCYLNAFLQLYFRFDKLRQAVFSLSDEHDETGIIHQLQLIFSQLQLSNCGVVDPGGLIEALRLCEEEQQDAPEFHCLFMHLLEARFQEAGLSVVEDFIRGEYVYETSCSQCDFISKRPAKFLELSLKVSSTSLVECIRDYFKAESLTGENRYACPRCLQKQNGIRRACITRAPSLLCIQLLRFTYDPRTGQRKKHKASVRLPDLLELTRIHDGFRSEHSAACLESDSGVTHCRLYRLCGVLLHIGAQPTSGHYVAVVRDSKRLATDDGALGLQESVQDQNEDCWSVCNDVEVCTIPASQFLLSKINGSSKSLQSLCSNFDSKCVAAADDHQLVPPAKRAANSRAHRAKKQRYDALHTLNSDSLGSSDCPVESSAPSLPMIPSESSECLSQSSVRWHSSSNAYMVFYQDVDDCREVQPVAVPDRLRELVEHVNSSNRQELRDREAAKVNKLSTLRNLLKMLWPPDLNCEQRSDVAVTTKAISLVPTPWLRDWLNHPELPALKHLSTLNESTPGSLTETEDASRQRCDQPPELPNPSQYAFPACPHGRVPVDLDPYTYRAVSTVGLVEAEGRLVDGISEQSSLSVAGSLLRFQPCRDCVCLKVALISLEQSIRALSKEMDSFVRSKQSALLSSHDADPAYSAEGEGSQFYWIGKRSLRMWRVLSRTYVRRLYSNPKSDHAVRKPPHTAFNADVLCSHGQLRSSPTRYLRSLPAALWHRLIHLFPGACIPTFPVDPMRTIKCPDCEQIEASLVERATRERQLLASLLLPAPKRVLQPVFDSFLSVDISKHNHFMSPRKHFQLQPVSNGTSPNSVKIPVKSELLDFKDKSTALRELGNAKVSCESDTVYLIPSDFLQLWRRFVKNPLPEMLPKYLPSGLNGDGVLCKHSQLAMPWWELVADSLLSPLSFFEWNVLSHAYPSVSPTEAYRTDAFSDDSTSDPDDSNHNPHANLILPPLYIIPDRSKIYSLWQLHPTEWATVCMECHTELLSDRNSFKNARIRIRLVTGPEEALNVMCLGTDSVETGCQGPIDLDQLTCQSVLNAQSSSYVETQTDQLTVAQTEQDRDENVKNISPDITEPFATKTERGKSKRSYPTFVRRSNRQRSHPNDLVVYGSSDQSLQQIKVQLMQLLGVTPADQHLMYKGVELCDHSKTLRELGISADSLLSVWTDSPVWNVSEGDQNPLCSKSSSSHKPLSKGLLSSEAATCSSNIHSVELGFKGTRLLEN
ncbi:Ubiquitin carboxyl-terminal hydrolase 48 [Paragonimus heterotremus]|uniref:Ubiquitin carboxyl-terminal hydrolase 48 n=1 Tax=Paragonimus heterotremus TaxID=100268 RepID=A0A8J4TLH7_9TREM|nr:Ubiquitin carboxyl-terminal hydrolase 48 [Paragonimus heterotremus]